MRLQVLSENYEPDYRILIGLGCKCRYEKLEPLFRIILFPVYHVNLKFIIIVLNYLLSVITFI